MSLSAQKRRDGDALLRALAYNGDSAIEGKGNAKKDMKCDSMGLKVWDDAR
jgi:hypothetical protein